MLVEIKIEADLDYNDFFEMKEDIEREISLSHIFNDKVNNIDIEEI